MTDKLWTKARTRTEIIAISSEIETGALTCNADDVVDLVTRICSDYQAALDAANARIDSIYDDGLEDFTESDLERYSQLSPPDMYRRMKEAEQRIAELENVLEQVRYVDRMHAEQEAQISSMDWVGPSGKKWKVDLFVEGDDDDAKNDELLPCPFCGGEAEVLRGIMVRDYVVSCTNCAALIELECDEMSDAIAVWNRRTPSPATEWEPDANDWAMLIRFAWAGFESGAQYDNVANKLQRIENWISSRT